MARKKGRKGTPKPRSTSVNIDYDRVLALLESSGKVLADIKNVSPSTVLRLSNPEKAVSMSTARSLAKDLECEVCEILIPSTDSTRTPSESRELREWKITRPLGEENERASNGLCFYRYQVRDAFLSTDEKPVLGRARVYSFQYVPPKTRSKMAERLVRHPQVSRELARFPHFVTNLAAAPVSNGDAWWVVDEWFEAKTLATVIREGGLDGMSVTSWMRTIAEGIKILCESQFVLRELAPQRLLVANDGQIRFTDLDLVKLLDGGKTVSSDWPLDLYRAPEVEGGNASTQSDIYSWAMIYLHTATGDLTLGPGDVDAIDRVDPGKEVKQLLKRCLSAMPSKRPRSADDLLAVLQ